MEEGDQSCVVSVEEDSEPVDWSWLEENLGLKKLSTTTNLNSLSNMVNIEDEASKEVGEYTCLIKSFSGKNLKLKEIKGQTKELKSLSKKRGNEVHLFHKKSYVIENIEFAKANVGDSRDVGKRNTKDKAKMIWVRRPKHRAMCPTPINAKVVLDKRSQLNKEDYNGDDSSTSSDEEQNREENVLSLTGEVEEQSNGEYRTPIVTKKTRGKKKDLPSKMHSMRTRMLRNREKNKEAMTEIEVVDTEGKNIRWILEEEMAKIIDTYVAIGYSFNGKDKDKAKEVIEDLRKRKTGHQKARMKK
ncbi:hypothetical protein LWI28_022896 [Acer negundo]|uniref:Ig-like domain-containing protein n=1 Tax=Acer negundo TaxID=4023 RepID=A0AAD5IWU6_ACENE|nr:hypothetical protein LWI28_022896 [Acer negundo]